MSSMVFLAILTNCAILGFSSEQLMQWAPSLFDRDTLDGDQVMAVGSGRWAWSLVSCTTLGPSYKNTHAHTHTHTHRYVVGIVFGFEHLLLIVAVWLQWVIKPQPKWVRLAIARREYLAKEKLSRQTSFSSSP